LTETTPFQSWLSNDGSALFHGGFRRKAYLIAADGRNRQRPALLAINDRCIEAFEMAANFDVIPR
jgi:hypothetical protein